MFMQATQLDLHRHFHALGAGVIEEVRVQRDKGFGFVRYSTHAEAALAIQMGNAQSILCGKPMKVGFPVCVVVFSSLTLINHSDPSVKIIMFTCGFCFL